MIFQSITEMLDNICVNCPNLKELQFFQEESEHLLKNVRIENLNDVLKDDRKKFPNLTCFSICFGGKVFPDTDIHRSYFNNYLRAKCPKISDEITFEVYPSGFDQATNTLYETVVYRTRTSISFHCTICRSALRFY